MAFIYTYRLAQGDFGLDKLNDFENPYEKVFIWIIFVVCSLFLVVLLMNLLISIMGSAYEKVQASIQNL
jgi:hypothetical protein